MGFKLNSKIVAVAAACVVASVASYLIAADHIDAPAVTGTGFDITDYYTFQSPSDANNMVFVVAWKGLLAPSATGAATFEDDLMIEINIDNSATKDQTEDLVIQATFENGKVIVRGPASPVQTGLTGKLVGGTTVEANITAYGSNAVVGEGNNMKIFAGPRDDPFFFDLNQFKAILAGTATSFNNPGMDTFAGTNALALVVELPKSMLGGANTINTWVTTNRKM